MIIRYFVLGAILLIVFFIMTYLNNFLVVKSGWQEKHSRFIEPQVTRSLLVSGI